MTRVQLANINTDTVACAWARVILAIPEKSAQIQGDINHLTEYLAMCADIICDISRLGDEQAEREAALEHELQHGQFGR